MHNVIDESQFICFLKHTNLDKLSIASQQMILVCILKRIDTDTFVKVCIYIHISIFKR